VKLFIVALPASGMFWGEICSHGVSVASDQAATNRRAVVWLQPSLSAITR
jgi:hypothetical protein